MSYQPQVDESRTTHWRLASVEKRVDNVETELRVVKEDVLPSIKEAVSVTNAKIDKLLDANSSAWPQNVQGWLALIATVIVILGGSWTIYTFAYNSRYGDDATLQSIMLKLDALQKAKENNHGYSD